MRRAGYWDSDKPGMIADLVYRKSIGFSPVRFAIRASMRGPIS